MSGSEGRFDDLQRTGEQWVRQSPRGQLYGAPVAHMNCSEAATYSEREPGGRCTPTRSPAHSGAPAGRVTLTA